MSICSKCKKNKLFVFVENCEARGCEIKECNLCRGLILKKRGSVYWCAKYWCAKHYDERESEESTDDDEIGIDEVIKIASTLNDIQRAKAKFLFLVQKQYGEYNEKRVYHLLKKVKEEK